jgi:predicted nucleic acid-binding protein
MPMPKAMTKFDADLATFLLGVDSLFGGDVMHESGTKHVIADTWTSGYPAPQIYHDPMAQVLREKDGVDKVDSETINTFVKKYRLCELPHELKNETQKLGQSNPDRMKYLDNLVDALEVMLRTAVAISNKRPLPSYDERYIAATARTLDDIALVDPTEDRELLRASLARAGYEVTPSRDLRGTMLAWHHDKGDVPVDRLSDKVTTTSAHLLQMTRKRIFPLLNFEIPTYNSDLSDVPFDGFRFKAISGVRFTGSSIYQGGVEKGKPLLKQLFEYNTDHPVGNPGLYHLCAHEVVPGHYLQSAVCDLLWLEGKLGFEATIGVMCSPSVAFREGWAQNAFNLIFGSREAAVQALGDDLRVELAYDDLQDIGKHNASIMYQRNGEDIDRVKQHIAEDCVQRDSIVKKLSGGWSKHPIIGPMYGPAYWLGRTVVNKAIDEVGREKVTRIGFQLDGLVDIKTFQDKVYR